MSAGIAGSLERIACALEELVRTAKEKENLPPTPPIREKEVCPSPDTNARAHVCEGMVVPTLGEIARSLERIACALEELVRTSKEKENLPSPTPPISEKEVCWYYIACSFYEE